MDEQEIQRRAERLAQEMVTARLVEEIKKTVNGLNTHIQELGTDLHRHEREQHLSKEDVKGVRDQLAERKVKSEIWQSWSGRIVIVFALGNFLINLLQQSCLHRTGGC